MARSHHYNRQKNAHPVIWNCRLSGFHAPAAIIELRLRNAAVTGRVKVPLGLRYTTISGISPIATLRQAIALQVLKCSHGSRCQQQHRQYLVDPIQNNPTPPGICVKPIYARLPNKRTAQSAIKYIEMDSESSQENGGQPTIKQEMKFVQNDQCPICRCRISTAGSAGVGGFYPI